MLTKKLYKSKIRNLLISLIIAFGSALLLQYVFYYYNTEKITVARVQKKIIAFEKRLDEKIEEISLLKLDDQSSVRNYLHQHYKNLYKEDKTEVVIYKNDSLTYWSDNVYPAEQILTHAKKQIYVDKKGNGFYLRKQKKVNEYTIVGVELIKYSYPYKNQYLPDEFNKALKVNSNYIINLDTPEINPILDSDGNYLFSLEAPQQKKQLKDRIIYISSILYIASLILLISFIYFSVSYIFRNKGPKIISNLIFVLLVILVRYIQQHYKIPNIFYNTSLFDPYHYATSSLLPSIGDFLLNMIAVLQITFLLTKYNSIKLQKNISKKYALVVEIGLQLVLIGIIYVSAYLIRTLVLNSTIDYDFENILSLDAVSHYAIMGIACVLLIVFFYSYWYYTSPIKHISVKQKQIISLTIITIIILIGLFKEGPLMSSEIILIIVFFALSFIKDASFIKSNSNVIKIIIMSVLSIYGTFIINRTETVRERNNRKIIVAQLADARDNMLEFYFEATKKDITSDTTIKNLINNCTNISTENEIINHIYQKHLSGFWDRYQTRITICNANKKLIIEPQNVEENCNEYFNNYISNYMRPIGVSGLYFLRQSVDVMYYMGKITLESDNNETFTLYIEITSNKLWKSEGYPELLIENVKHNTLNNYSYAYYLNNELIRNVGDFSYDVEFHPAFEEDNMYYISFQDHSHLVYSPNEETTVLLSLKNDTVIEVISPFAYLLILMILYTVAIFILSGNIKNDFKISYISLRDKVQMGVIILIIFITLILATISLNVIYQINREQTVELLKQKLNTIVLEIESHPEIIYYLSGETDDNDIEKEDISTTLTNLSDRYFTDIIIYDSKGFVKSSSRSKIFDKELVSEQINADCFYKLDVNKKTFVFNEENIGNYKYLSAYTPIRNYDNKSVAIINIPYYTKQDDIVKKTSNVIIAFSNVYIIITIITLFVAYVVTSYITKPLQIIANKFRKVKIGDTNAKIEWHRDDEIGKLIEEYNRMIDELAKNAEILARTEREGAWQQMAKQVAHEIKNPLTPIKLSTQLLMKAWEEDSPDKEERLKKFAETLITQIDTLSTIASEFSDFAQMPKPIIEKIDIIPIIQQSVEIFKGQKNRKIILNNKYSNCFVYADSNHMLRVFNNIIKNALQSIPTYKKGIVEIEIIADTDKEKCLISVKDNGTGIPKEKQSKIFSPEFTTKTTGMGLGLAMCKNIIIEIKGRIWFETAENVGTTFFVEIPLCEEQNF
ncbi:MAG: HAMP domain-containing sensor histidine kinase [Bacteroidales bacterium]